MIKEKIRAFKYIGILILNKATDVENISRNCWSLIKRR